MLIIIINIININITTHHQVYSYNSRLFSFAYLKRIYLVAAQLQNTFYIHDYETFGISPAYDRPAQFAGVRTDSEFNIIEEPLVIFCKPADDYLPNPEAVLITGITPQLALQKGVNEAEFSKQIHQAFSKPNTCVMGYNNIRFDDEVTRNVFYRNFYDPYAYSWQEGNSRWDMIDVVRACYALRPDGINWPLNDEGLPSFKLEHLTKANNIEHLHAHDAMSDVYATIAIAKLVKQAQPRLFNYFYQLRSKNKVKSLIDIPNMTPLLHVSGMFGSKRGNISWIVPLGWHPQNNNAVIVCDLAGDITPLLNLDSSTLRERLYTRKKNLASDQTTIPLKLVHINKCPILAPAKSLTEDNILRLNINRQHCLDNLQCLRNNPHIREKIIAIYEEPDDFPVINDVDGQLYNGFFSEADRTAMAIIRQTLPQNLPALDITFADKRLTELLFRYRARNYSATLNDQEQQRWLAYRKSIFTEEKLVHYLRDIERLFELHYDNEKKINLLHKLIAYLQKLVG